MNTLTNNIELIPSIMNIAEKTLDQLDTQLARYGQNREQTSG
jgi:hypothetical protein